MKRRNRTGCGCFLLIAAILCVGALRLALHMTENTARPGEYPNAERSITAFCAGRDLELSDYPADLVALLERNPETEDFVLHYPLTKDEAPTADLSGYDLTGSVPLFLQWDRQWGHMQYGSGPAALTACGPMCLSMAACYLTGDDDFNPVAMMEFAEENGYYSPGNGSSWSLISEGAVKLGFDVTEIPLVKQRILDNLAVGNPIICAMGPGDFTTEGHYIVLTGTSDGLIRVNDPNSRENSERLWAFEDIESQFRNLWVIRN